MGGVITTWCIFPSVVHFVQLGRGQGTKCLTMCLHHDVDLIDQVLVHIRIKWELEGRGQGGGRRDDKLRMKYQHRCMAI